MTFAEIPPNPESYPGALPEMLYAGSSVFIKPKQRVNMNLYNWWHFLPGADWRHPFGPTSSLEGLEMHPVVHIAYVMRKPMRNERGRLCRRKRSGSLPHAEASTAPHTRGVRTSFLTDITWRIPGKANFPG